MNILTIAAGEIGYLEKASNAFLQHKTANPGSNNFTKYGAWYQGGALQGQPWCDMFVSWCAHQAGEADAVGCFAYVPSHVAFFKARGQYFARGARTPRPGDVIFFRDESHVGLVESVSASAVTTIEGNTSGGSALVANGGAVCRKTYPLTSAYIQGYGRPAYKDAAEAVDSRTPEIYYRWKTYRNGSTPEPVYKDTGRTVPTGSLNPGETCWCAGKYGDSFLVCYGLDGSAEYAVGYVGYDGVA